MFKYNSWNITTRNNNNNNNEKRKKTQIRRDFKHRRTEENKFGMPIPNNANAGMYLVVPNGVLNRDSRHRFYTHVNATGSKGLPVGSAVRIHPTELKYYISNGFYVYLHPLRVFLKRGTRSGIMNIMNSTNERKIQNDVPVISFGMKWDTIISKINLDNHIKNIRKTRKNELEILRVAQVLNKKGMPFQNVLTLLGSNHGVKANMKGVKPNIAGLSIF
jgi:hypothetical protein